MKTEKILDRFGLTQNELINLIPDLDKSQDKVFLSGSLFDDLGNSKSDLDIFVIKSDWTEVERSIENNIIHNHQRYDVVYLDEQLISDVNTTLRSMDFTCKDVWVPRSLCRDMSEYETVTLVHRLRVGEPILNKEAFNTMKDNFHFEKYRNWMIRLKVNEYDNNCEDFVGSIQDGEMVDAAYMFRDIIGPCMDAWIHYKGETIDRAKWRFKKLDNICLTEEEKEIASKFVHYGFLNPLDSDIEEKMEDGYYFCEEIIKQMH